MDTPQYFDQMKSQNTEGVYKSLISLNIFNILIQVKNAEGLFRHFLFQSIKKLLRQHIRYGCNNPLSHHIEHTRKFHIA
jgi:hypothetical protein